MYKNLIDSSGINNYNTIDEFYYGIIYPFEKFTSGLIKSEISPNRNVVFIYQKLRFVENHFRNLFETIEGSACCADKSRAIVKRLIEFYKNGTKIEFDYNGEYTFHLPKKIFKTHESIICFYEGLHSLYYGISEKYLTALLNLKKSIKE